MSQASAQRRPDSSFNWVLLHDSSFNWLLSHKGQP